MTDTTKPTADEVAAAAALIAVHGPMTHEDVEEPAVTIYRAGHAAGWDALLAQVSQFLDACTDDPVQPVALDIEAQADHWRDRAIRAETIIEAWGLT